MVKFSDNSTKSIDILVINQRTVLVVFWLLFSMTFTIYFLHVSIFGSLNIIFLEKYIALWNMLACLFKRKKI